MTASEIRDTLINNYGYTQEEVDGIKGVAALRAALGTAVAGDVLSPTDEPDIEELDDGYDDSTSSDEIGPLSPEWHDYVMGLFSSDELIEYEGEKRPTVHGLRRVAQICFGEMLENHATVLDAPKESNGFCATASCSVLFWDERSGRERKFTDVADVSDRNCEAKYAKHATSTAATKAEARALRKMLGLRNISSEESTPSILPHEEVRTDTITDIQIMAIDRVCQRNDINVVEFVNSGECKYKNIKEVKDTRAETLLSILNEDSKRNEYITDKPSCVGYQKTWRDTFA